MGKFQTRPKWMNEKRLLTNHLMFISEEIRQTVSSLNRLDNTRPLCIGCKFFYVGGTYVQCYKCRHQTKNPVSVIGGYYVNDIAVC